MIPIRMGEGKEGKEKMKSPKVSVVIPAYNHEKFIGEAIQSVLDQTFQDFELIIINDGSTDNTEAEILKFKDDRIQYYFQSNRGLSPTLNRGIELARGEFFNFLPSDDIFLPEKLAIQLKAFEGSEEIGVVFSYHLVVDGEGREVKDDPIVDWFTVPFETKEEIFPALFERDFLSVPTALIRMDCFRRVGLFDESLKTAQDYDMWMRILKYDDLRLIKKVLLKLRWHGKNLTYRVTPETELERAKVLVKAYRSLRIEDIFPSLHHRKDALAYADAYERLAAYMEKSGLPALIPISQIHKDQAMGLKEKRRNVPYSLKDLEEEEEWKFAGRDITADTERINLLIETPFLDKGGVENVIHGIATKIDSSLFNPVIVCTIGGGQIAEKIRSAGIPVEVLGEEKEKEYLEILRRYRIDLVNSHYSFLGTPIAYQRGIPVISFLHSIYSWYSHRILDEFRIADQYISRYIAVSPLVASFARHQFNISPHRMRVIPDGLDIDRLKQGESSGPLTRNDLGMRKEDFIFLHVGAINQAKMHNLLIAAMAEMVKNYPFIKLLCVGQILDEDYNQFIREKVKEHGLDPHIKFVGFVENPVPYYQLADAFLLPSLVEGWGLTTLEAMYYELPLILTPVGAAREVIDDNDIGLLIENCCEDPIQLKGSDWAFYSHLDYPKNTPHLVRAMQDIYTNRQIWKGKARKGKMKVLSRFTLEKIIQEYEREFTVFAFEAKKRKESRLELIAREQKRRLDEQTRSLDEQTRRLDEQTKRLDEQTEGLIRGLDEQTKRLDEQTEGLIRGLGEQTKRLDEQTEGLTRGLDEQTKRLDEQTEGLIRGLDEGAKRFDEHTREMRERFSQVEGKIFSLTAEFQQGFNFINHQLNYILVRLSLTERIKGLILRITSLFRRKGPKQTQYREEDKIEPPLNETEEKPLPQPAKKIRENPYGWDKKGFAMICLPIIDWNFRFQRPQQILSQFAHQGYRVFYATTTFIEKRSPGFEKSDLEDLIQIKRIKENIYTLSLVSNSSLNLYRDSIDREEDLRFLKWSIDILREKADIENLLLYVNLPFWYPLAESLSKESNTKVVYDCMDYHPGFSTNTDRMVGQEENLSKLADLVITSSQKLYQLHKRLNPRSILVRNGTDFKHFSRLEPRPLPNNVKKPVIGYYGAISDWFDMDLVRKVALSRPDWSFVLIGHTFGANLDLIKGIQNIYLLGEKNYQELPGFLYHFDVCTIPFRLNELTEATNPVKVYEYLSAGKPVVATKLPELEEFSPFIYIAENHDDFIDKLEIALNENDNALRKKRVSFAEENGWDQRFAKIEKAVKDIFPKVSIIVVSFNNLEYLRLCIESIFEYSNYPNFEVIVVDNSSLDGSAEYLKGKKEEGKIETILNPQNLGFAKANNQGIEIASGEYIILLNDDTVVTQNWIFGLIKYLNLPGIGMVGPVTNEIGNEAKINIAYSSLEEMRGWAEEYTRAHKEKYFEIKMLALFCIAFKKSLLDDVGLLDERFEIGMFEDDDFSVRVKNAGYQTICAEDVFIHHFGKASFKKLRDQEYLRLFNKNKELFENKWNITWEAHKYRD